MTIEEALEAIVNLLQALPVESGPQYRQVRTKEDLEDQFADRLFNIIVIRRLGPYVTDDLYPEIEYLVELRLQLVSGDFDIFLDMQRLTSESNTLCKALERDSLSEDLHVNVGQTRFENDLAITELSIITRES